jgi:glycosyltransferase involved in cell wall biosynthesis
MRVVQLTSSRLNGYGGIQSFVKCLSSGFTAASIATSEVMLPSLDPNHLPHSNDSNHRCSFLKFQDDLLQMLTSEPGIVVQSHNLHLSHPFGVADTVMECIQSAKVPHICTVHDVGRVAKGPADILARSLCVTTSEFNRDRLANDFGVRSVPIIPPPIDFEALRCTCPAIPRQIAYPGRIVASKGAHTAVTLIGYLTQDIGDLRLVLSERGLQCYGENQKYIESLQEIASHFPRLELSFYENANNEMAGFYSGAQMALSIPIAPQGFNLSILESLACERPVVAVPTGGMSWTRDVPGCISVEDRSGPQLANSIFAILSNGDHWISEASRSRERLKPIHDKNIVARQYLELYAKARKAIRR